MHSDCNTPLVLPSGRLTWGDWGDLVTGGYAVIRWIVHVSDCWANRIGQLELTHQLLQQLHSLISAQVHHDSFHLGTGTWQSDTWGKSGKPNIWYMIYVHLHRARGWGHCWLLTYWWGSAGWSWGFLASCLPVLSTHSLSPTMQTHPRTVETALDLDRLYCHSVHNQCNRTKFRCKLAQHRIKSISTRKVY